MADNIAVTAGTGTTIATDDISSVHYQRVKLTAGQDGVAEDLLTPNVYKTLNAVNINSDGTLWTPASGKKFRLMGGTISVDVAGSVLFEDAGTTTIFRTPVLIANAPYTFDLGNGVLSATADNLLKATLASAAITGTIWGIEV